MTALQKKDGGVRGIATGTSFRRLVAKTLARQSVQWWRPLVQISNLLCQLEQVDGVGHAVRAATDENPKGCSPWTEWGHMTMFTGAR